MMDYLFILTVAILVFCLDQGIFGKNLKSIYSTIFNVKNVGYLALLFMLVLLFLNLDYSIEYCINKDIEDKLKAAASINNSVHVHNPNINISGSMANALTNVGIGAAVGGISAGAKIVKSSSLPILGKLGIVIAGGLGSGVITAGTSAAIKISNHKDGPSSTSTITDNNFSAKSIDDNIELESVMTLLNSEFILNIVIVYLVISLLTLYLIDMAIKNNSEFTLLKNFFSEHIYKFFISTMKFSSKSNKTFLLITWTILFICCVSSLSFSYFILNNIDIISDIIKYK
jgi:hypothetical protein